MKKTIAIRTFVILFILLISIFCFIKFNTNIYVGNYSYDPYSIDIQLKIDNKLILNDTLVSSPFFPVIVKEKLRYGFHKVEISSQNANIKQESKLFLLPNQHISIEFLGADTVRLKEKIPYKEKIPLNEKDSIENAFFLSVDTMKTVVRPESTFIIESSFNPFRTQ